MESAIFHVTDRNEEIIFELKIIIILCKIQFCGIFRCCRRCCCFYMEFARSIMKFNPNDFCCDNLQKKNSCRCSYRCLSTQHSISEGRLFYFMYA
jgi:hypothetical protein